MHSHWGELSICFIFICFAVVVIIIMFPSYRPLKPKEKCEIIYLFGMFNTNPLACKQTKGATNKTSIKEIIVTTTTTATTSSTAKNYNDNKQTFQSPSQQHMNSESYLLFCRECTPFFETIHMQRDFLPENSKGTKTNKTAKGDRHVGKLKPKGRGNETNEDQH